MYAVVSTGGKQYRVEPGATLSIERLDAEPGTEVTFDRVLLVGDGDEVTIGTPVVSGITVRGTVIGQERGRKLVIFKFRQKVKYRRRRGHRQQLTHVRIDTIDGDRGRRPRKAASTTGAGAAPESARAEGASAPKTTPKPTRRRAGSSTTTRAATAGETSRAPRARSAPRAPRATTRKASASGGEAATGDDQATGGEE
jgi:large subunit ribosomal protein L21